MNFSSRCHLVFLIFLPLLRQIHLCDGRCPFPALFNFGDSNSDTGGLVGAFGPQPPPHGMTFFHKPAGRYCDGRLVIDFIAEAIGLPFLDAYLQAVGSNFSTGANFATAGSTIRRENSTLWQSGFSPFSLDVQVSQFVEFKQRSLEYYHQEPYSTLLPDPTYFSKALYVLDIGQNDLTSGYFRNLTVRQVKGFIPEVLQEFSSHVKTLYQEGARNFLIINTGPVGCLPYIITRLPFPLSKMDSHGCATPYNNVAKFYNQKLRTTVDNLRKVLAGSTFMLADSYGARYSIFQNVHKDGFRFTLKACCGFGGGPYNFNRTIGCGGTANLGGTLQTYNVCKDPSVYVSWDGVHYTEAANRLIADAILSGNFSQPTFSMGHFCDIFSSL